MEFKLMSKVEVLMKVEEHAGHFMHNGAEADFQICSKIAIDVRDECERRATEKIKKAVIWAAIQGAYWAGSKIIPDDLWQQYLKEQEDGK